MNNLNSILLEGYINKIKKQTDERVKFTVISNRYIKGDTGYIKHTIEVTVVAEGKLAESVKAKLKKERGCRIVGRLDDVDGESCVVAEHVEFRPELRDAKEETSEKSNSTKKKQ